RVPHAADLRAVHAGTAEGGATDAVHAHRAEAVATDRVFAARIGSAVTRLCLEAERNGRGCVVEVTQALDVEAVVAVRVERAGALEVRGHVVALARILLRHPLHGFHGLRVTANTAARAAGRQQLHRRRIPARVRAVRAA